MTERQHTTVGTEEDVAVAAWPRVGGVIASRIFTANSPVTSTGAGGPNVSAFEDALNAIPGVPVWRPKYHYVRPWEDTEVNSAADDLFADTLVQVIIVTGTTLSEKVQARCPASPDPGYNKWIVMATDDGKWIYDLFAASWMTDFVTGMTSGYSDIVDRRVKKLYSEYKRSKNPGDMDLAVLQADPSQLGMLTSYALTEKVNDFTAIQKAVLPKLSSIRPREFFVHATTPAPSPATFTIDPVPAGANAVLVLADAITFLARSSIEAMLKGDANIKVVQLPHSTYKWTGMGSDKAKGYGPNMPYRYADAADYAYEVLTTPGSVSKPKKLDPDVDFEDS
ncbi:MAG TPA: hypothetical protein VII06_17675 [Chloroflexota bacterium]|jgi:hypothetical protein